MANAETLSPTDPETTRRGRTSAVQRENQNEQDESHREFRKQVVKDDRKSEVASVSYQSVDLVVLL
jgi:hypothetical protein